MTKSFKDLDKPKTINESSSHSSDFADSSNDEEEESLSKSGAQSSSKAPSRHKRGTSKYSFYINKEI